MDGIDWWREHLGQLFRGAGSYHTDPHDQQILITLILAFALPTLLGFSIAHWYLGHTMLAVSQWLMLAALLPAFHFARNIETLHITERMVMGSATIIFLAILIDGGIDRTGMSWPYIYPFLAFSMMGLRHGWHWVGLFLAGFVAIAGLWRLGLMPLVFSATELLIFLTAFLFYTLIASVFELLRERRQTELQTANQKLAAARDELAHSQDILEQEVKRRTRELHEANLQLVDEIERRAQSDAALKESEARFVQAQKMEAIGTLVGGIAHDFNNMLSGVNANIFLLKRKIKDPDHLVRLQDIEQLIVHASDMVRQLLTFARQDRVELKPFNLTPFVKEAMKLGEISIPERIKLRFNFSMEKLPILGNTTQLQQVLINLINNACDALEKTAKPIIHVEIGSYRATEAFKRRNPGLPTDHFVRLIVADNGTGVPAKILDKIFDPFFTTKAAGKGTGLGLAMSYGAINSHGGVIEVRSRAGRGTAFIIYLPFCEEARQDVAASAPPARSGKGELILLADDDSLLRRAHRDVLEDLGYRVVEAGNGEEAIECVRNQPDIRLAILDVMMPVMGGAAASREIKAVRPDIAIVFVTGYDKESSLASELPLQNGATVLDKPISVEQLSQAIHRELNKAK